MSIKPKRKLREETNVCKRCWRSVKDRERERVTERGWKGASENGLLLLLLSPPPQLKINKSPSASQTHNGSQSNSSIFNKKQKEPWSLFEISHSSLAKHIHWPTAKIFWQSKFTNVTLDLWPVDGPTHQGPVKSKGFILWETWICSIDFTTICPLALKIIWFKSPFLGLMLRSGHYQHLQLGFIPWSHC